MIGRVAALLILVSQGLLLAVVFDPTGPRALWFAFVGHPTLAAGVVLGAISIVRRTRLRKRS